MRIEYPEIGICGLSCRLCPRYHTDGKSQCKGCKSEIRMAAGCSFITCAIKNHELEFCWDCYKQTHCAKWRKHRETGKIRDSFKCYQKLEANIAFIQAHGVIEFVKQQRMREQLLTEMLRDFNEGRSKRYYCIAATVFPINELRHLIQAGNEQSRGLPIKQKSHVLHSLLNEVARRKKYLLKLRK